MKKALFTFVVVILATTRLLAVEAEVNGINYNFTKLSKTAEVIALSSGKYTGSVVIPATVVYENTTYNVTSIGIEAFKYCFGLTSVTIPNSVTNIGSEAFYECSGLTSVTIPNSVTSIGNDAFYHCSGLTSVTIPNSVTNIGSEAFDGCFGLTSVTIPNSVTSIEYRVFGACYGLDSITIPNSVTSIGKYAFSGCSGLTSITIPESVTSIGDYAFYYCSGLTAVHISDLEVWCGLTFYSYANPLEYAHHLYLNGTEVTDLVIPNSITSIKIGAFNGCSGLTSVTIPNSVTSIGNNAFSGCSGLTSVNIGDGVTSIGSSAFYGCSGLTSITIPNSVTGIGGSVFSGCTNLTSVTIGRSVENIGSYHGQNYTFKDCESLELITCLAANPPLYGSETFWILPQYTLLQVPCGSEEDYRTAWGFSNIQTIDSTCPSFFPENQKIYYTTTDGNKVNITGHAANIVSNTYVDGQGCIVFDSDLTSIASYAFASCSTLVSISIPSSVTYIGSDAFKGCSNLESVHISDIAAWCGIQFGNYYANPVSTHHLYLNGTEVTDLIIPDTVTSIGDYAFRGCSGLTSITIPNSVTSIGSYAFDYCSGLTSVTIGNSVTSIGNNAFSDCSGLTSITCEAATPPTCESSNWLFYGVSTSFPVYVPCDAVSAYQAAEGWSRFTNIQPIEGSCAPQICGDSLYWSIENDTLYITGTGDMYDYNDSNNKASWRGVTFTSVLFPEGITSIGEYAFKGCSGLTSVTIPNSVTSIGERAFEGCTNLTSIICEAQIPPTCGSGCFSNVSSSVLIYVPCESLRDYQHTNGWWNFGSDVYRIIPGTGCSGQCGDNLYWELLNDTLSITGTGDMYNYDFMNNPAPWYGLPFSSISLTEGMTGIGDRAFGGSKITTVSIPSSVTYIGRDAFSSCWNLTSITIPMSVRNIVPTAFYGCFGLTSIVVEQGNTVYDSRDNSNAIISTNSNSLLVGCQNTVIPGSVTSINEGAFSECIGLTSITIPNSVTKIGYYAFDGCTNLASITCKAMTPPICQYSCFGSVPTSIPVYVPCDAVTAYQAAEGWSTFTNIQPIDGTCPPMCGDNLYWSFADGELTIRGMGAMYDYDTNPTPWDTLSITSVSFLDGMTSIGKYAFLECTGLTSVTIPNSVTSIERYAFYDCNSLASVSIQEGVTSISYGAFGYCRALKQLTIPNSVINIGDYAFVGCWNLKSLTIPENVTSIGECAFSGCSDLTSITCEATTPPTCGNYCFSSVPTSIPVYVPCESVEAYQAASGWSNFTNIQVIDGSCESESDKCGDDLYWSVDNDVLTITGSGAMYNYNNSDNLAPWAWSNITSVVLPDGITTIGEYAFYGCYSLPTITIPASVIHIGYRSFEECWALYSFDYQGNTATASNDLFNYDYKYLSYYRGPASVNVYGASYYIVSNGDAGLWYCPLFSDHMDLANLQTRVYHSDYDYYSVYPVILSNRTDLLSLVLPDDCMYISSSTCKGDLRLQSITIPESVTTIGSQAFEDCRSLQSVTFAGNNNVDYIGDWAFYNCHLLRDITLPEGVEYVGTSAFYGCSYLENINLPSSLQTIEDNAFATCSRVTRMRVGATIPPVVSARTFFEVDRSIEVRVPVGSLELYQNDIYWSEFFNLAEDVSTGINDGVNKNTPSKIFRNGQLLIQNVGSTYNVQGVKVE